MLGFWLVIVIVVVRFVCLIVWCVALTFVVLCGCGGCFADVCLVAIVVFDFFREFVCLGLVLSVACFV